VETCAAFRRRAEERRSLATRLALRALQDLERQGIRAWIVGSLAKGSFSPHSDVDFVVDCPPEAEYEVFRAIERAMGAFPFHMIPYGRVVADTLPLLMEGALDASGCPSSFILPFLIFQGCRWRRAWGGLSRSSPWLK
jgi:predicted nucleotidyltransferase